MNVRQRASTHPIATTAARKDVRSAVRWPQKQRGFALVMVLLLSIISLSIALFAAVGSRTEMSLAHNDLLVKQALNAAEAGVAHAARVISNHAVPDDELAANSGGVCSGNGVGNSSAGIATIGSVVQLNGVCYRFRQFGPDESDGYYLFVSDNHDEGAAADDPFHDKDYVVRVTSVGVVGTAVRTIRVTLTGQSAFGFFGINKVKLSGGAQTDSFVGTYSAGTAQNTSRVGSNADIDMSGGSTKIGGDALAGGTVSTSGGSSVTGMRSNGAAPQTFPVVADCSPYSVNSGVTPSSAYNVSTGKLNMSGGGTIALAPGTYCFSEVTLSGGSTLTITGMTTLNVTGKFDSSGGSVSNTTHDAFQFKVNVSGATDAKISGGSDSYMTLYAPGSDVDVSGSSDYYGSIIGKTLTASGGSALHQQKNPSDLWAMSATHEVR